jgi:hypothetical protein
MEKGGSGATPDRENSFPATIVAKGVIVVFIRNWREVRQLQAA